MTTILTRSTNGGFLSGEWNGIPETSLEVALIASCPKCGHAENIAEYCIGRAGIVFPKLECKGEGCSFDDYIVLDGWPRR